MSGRYGSIDYARATKLGVLLGLGLLAVGAGGETVGPSLVGTLPAWGDAALVDAEILGVLLVLLSPFVFGVLLPLTE